MEYLFLLGLVTGFSPAAVYKDKWYEHLQVWAAGLLSAHSQTKLSNISPWLYHLSDPSPVCVPWVWCVLYFCIMHAVWFCFAWFQWYLTMLQFMLAKCLPSVRSSWLIICCILCPCQLRSFLLLLLICKMFILTGIARQVFLENIVIWWAEIINCANFHIHWFYD